MEKSGIYLLKCANCDMKYIGMTKGNYQQEDRSM
jgi:hypothetical protein